VLAKSPSMTPVRLLHTFRPPVEHAIHTEKIEVVGNARIGELTSIAKSV